MLVPSKSPFLRYMLTEGLVGCTGQATEAFSWGAHVTSHPCLNTEEIVFKTLFTCLFLFIFPLINLQYKKHSKCTLSHAHVHKDLHCTVVSRYSTMCCIFLLNEIYMHCHTTHKGCTNYKTNTLPCRPIRKQVVLWLPALTVAVTLMNMTMRVSNSSAPL